MTFYMLELYIQRPEQRTEMFVSNTNATIPPQQGSPHTEKSITMMIGYNTNEGMQRINMRRHFYHNMSKQRYHHLHCQSRTQQNGYPFMQYISKLIYFIILHVSRIRGVC